VTYVRRCPGVHCLDAVLLVLVDPVEFDPRAGGRAIVRGIVAEPAADGHRVALLTAVQRRIGIPDQGHVVVSDAPVKRVAALDTFVAYAPVLEDTILPQVDDVLKTILEVNGY